MQNGSNTGLPKWDLTPVYKGFDDPEFVNDRKNYNSGTANFLSRAGDTGAAASNPEKWLEWIVSEYNRLSDLFENLISYTYCRFSTATTDPEATRMLNALEAEGLPLRNGIVVLRNTLAGIQGLDEIIQGSEILSEYQFFFTEQLTLQQYQMPPALENLGADLSRPGGDAWSRMQESISSTLACTWDEESGEQKTINELRGLAFHSDRDVREKAYIHEIELWKSMEIPMAYSLNGVKGFTDILNSRRGYERTLDKSIFQARIDSASLNSLISAMENSLPMFRKYLKAKAQLLGIEKCAFYDIFAPVGKSGKTWSFAEAKELIIKEFTAFSQELGAFAKEAFDKSWIDAEPRKGKVGGAYCISLPLPGESRILCNFDGSFSSLTTVAHELGHAFHHHVLKDDSAVHREYPMTLAETASIFSETLVFNGALKHLEGEERIQVLETFLADSTQVIVDILSRYYFENQVMNKRKQGELSPREFSDLMIEAQKKTYGDGLDQDKLHQYMWAVKGHYYRQELAFYNFPYAFGQLFGLGLYSLYLNNQESFPEIYNTVLKQTGNTDAVSLCKSVGFDIRSQGFWDKGIKAIENYVDEFTKLVSERV
ncbi:MAG: M3 family oligoendopeptidase [Spirochaetia bacterium]